MSGGAVVAWQNDAAQRLVAQFDGFVRGGRVARISAGGAFTGWTAATAGVVAPSATIAAYADTTSASDLWLRRLVVVPGLVDYDSMRRFW
jgi:hypothetical protein